jgi:hypothetical protein
MFVHKVLLSLWHLRLRSLLLLKFMLLWLLSLLLSLLSSLLFALVAAEFGDAPPPRSLPYVFRHPCALQHDGLQHPHSVRVSLRCNRVDHPAAPTLQGHPSVGGVTH